MLLGPFKSASHLFEPLTVDFLLEITRKDLADANHDMMSLRGIDDIKQEIRYINAPTIMQANDDLCKRSDETEGEIPANEDDHILADPFESGSHPLFLCRFGANYKSKCMIIWI